MAESLAPFEQRVWARDSEGAYRHRFETDAFLEMRVAGKGLCIQHNIDYAKSVARRATECAYWMADGVIDKGAVSADFNKLDSLARGARDQIDALIDHLCLDCPREITLAHTIMTAQIGISELPFSERRQQSRDDAAALLRALEVATRLAEAAPRKEARVKQGRVHEGNKRHSEFMKPLADAWMHLFGKKPSSNKDWVASPFLQFARASWSDAYPEIAVPEFTGAIRKLPKWTNEFAADFVKKQPEWL